MKITKHRPRHINQTAKPYFLTGRTYLGLPYFDTDRKKEAALFDPSWAGRKASPSEARTVPLSAIRLACQKYHLALDGWVILDNHYHLLFRPPGCAWNSELARDGSTGSPQAQIADKSASSHPVWDSELARDGSTGSPQAQIAGKPASSSNTRNSEFTRKSSEIAPLGAIKNFRIGKIAGTIHGKSSSLLKELADKSANSENNRSSELARDQIADKSAISERKVDKSATAYAAWWSAKYWEEIKHRNIALYGNRSQLAEEKRAKEFQRLLREGTPAELANFVKKIDRIWYQYTDHVIRDEGDYFRHLNYIHQNPVKHGYVKDMAEYQFSSYNRYLKEKGKKWLADCFARYPIVDFMPKGIGE